MFDVIIIGAGIIGSLIAYDLSKYQLSIKIIEKSEDIACGSSMANSAIVHAGYDPEEGTLKALLNVKGARMYPALCKELMCHYERIGSYVLGRNEEEVEVLKKLARNCETRGISYALHERKEIDEPHISEEVLMGLYCPETAIITPWEVAIAAVESAMDNGASLNLNEEVKAMEELSHGYRVITSKGSYESRIVINCAGVHSDEVANLIYPTEVEVKAKRGEYFVLDHPKEEVVKHVIYPVPTSKGKGVLVLPTIHHNILVGPTSDYIDEKDDVATTQKGLNEVRSKASLLIKDLPMHTIIRTYAGNRPSGSRHDFVLEQP
ncbi:MAG: NAD(P)/FAD-dependent oxidoreductase, partial [Erysipelotrichaceae bacterium]|nr:NAD(P)/FAD-dependent oxidoreductase [Erysipelotrichaceae bacterium]